MQLENRTQVESGLYAATAERLLARLRSLDQEVTSVLVIGHNPGLQDLALQLAGDDLEVVMQLREKFPTGAIAEVVADCDSWSDLTPGSAHVASLTVSRDSGWASEAEDSATFQPSGISVRMHSLGRVHKRRSLPDALPSRPGRKRLVA